MAHNQLALPLGPLLVGPPINQVSWVDIEELAIWIRFVTVYDTSNEVSMHEIFCLFKFSEAPYKMYDRISVTVFGQVFVKAINILNLAAVRKTETSKLWFLAFNTVSSLLYVFSFIELIISLLLESYSTLSTTQS